MTDGLYDNATIFDLTFCWLLNAICVSLFVASRGSSRILTGSTALLEWVVYRKGVERGIAIEYQGTPPEEDRPQSRIVLFADKAASVTSIADTKPGSSQRISQNLLGKALVFLDDNTRARREVLWVPGQLEMEGNNIGGRDSEGGDRSQKSLR